LQGGVLLMTPLKAVDGHVYAVAQGAVSVGGFLAESGNGDSAQKNHPTVGTIAKGAIVERAIPFDLFASNQVKIVLREGDFITATRVQDAINKTLGEGRAKAIDNTSVVFPLKKGDMESPVELIAKLEEIEVHPDITAKVVMNERTGTIVMGQNVKVSTVALAHGNLNITIQSENQVSQPNAFAGGETVQVQNSLVQAGEDRARLHVVKESVKIEDVVNSLNALGATPRDLIAIFQALQKSGALQAELVIM